MKTLQMLKMNCFGVRFSVVYQEGKMNPFVLYRHTREVNRYGYPTERKRIAGRYANFESCLWHLAQLHAPEFFREN